MRTRRKKREKRGVRVARPPQIPDSPPSVHTPLIRDSSGVERPVLSGSGGSVASVHKEWVRYHAEQTSCRTHFVWHTEQVCRDRWDSSTTF